MFLGDKEGAHATSTIRVMAGGGTWAMRTRPVPHALRELVLRYGGFEEGAHLALTRREMPYAGTPLILTFGAPYLLSEAIDPDRPAVSRRSFVAGIHETRTTSKTTGATWTVQIDLTPIGAYRIIGLPMIELTNRVVDAVEVLGPSILEFEQRLYHALTWEERFDIIDTYLLHRLDRGPRESPEITWVWRQLRAAHGDIEISALGEELQWSRKRLTRTFRDQLGVGPKMAGRILRFQRLLALDRSFPGASWSDLALRSGYFDQAHLIREFREFTGITPGAYRQLDRGIGLVESVEAFAG